MKKYLEKSVFDLPDNVLIEAYCKYNSQAAALVLYLRYKPYILGILRNLEVDYDDCMDLAQEVVIKVFTCLPTHYEEKGSFKQWVKRITINVVRDYFRRCARKLEVKDYDLSNLISSPTSIRDIIMKENIFIQLQEAISKLSEASQKLLSMVFKEGKCYREIGEEIGLSKAGSHKRMLILLRHLREVLKSKGIHELPEDF